MLIVESHSKAARKMSKLMFVCFLVTFSFGLLLTMHFRTTPKGTK
jgi:hypothetical protein